MTTAYQRGFVAPLIIGVVLLIGGGIYYYTKNISGTSQVVKTYNDTNTYNDPDGLFSFQYPKRLEIEYVEDVVKFVDPASVILKTGTGSTKQTYKNILTIQVQPRTGDISSGSTQLNRLGSLPGNSISKNDFTLDGRKGIRIEFTQSDSMIVTYVVPIIHGGEKFTFIANIISRDKDIGWLGEASKAVETTRF